MIGLSTGPGSGHLIAQLMCGETPTIDPLPFSLARFESGGRSTPTVPAMEAVEG